MTPSERDWLRVRSYLAEHRYDLAVRAAADYPAGAMLAGTPLLTAPRWRLEAPIRLDDIGLSLEAGRDPVLANTVLPERPDGTRYGRYSEVMRALAAPAVFENRPTYRLTAADLTARKLTFGPGRYFDGIDTGEAAAHEFAEELGGHPEGFYSEPFARRLSDGLLGIWCLGLGVDPLTYATDLLTAVVIEGEVFDELFGAVARDNAEGQVLRARAFSADVIEQVVTGEPIQAAGAALLRLAWRHRDRLLVELEPHLGRAI